MRNFERIVDSFLKGSRITGGTQVLELRCPQARRVRRWPSAHDRRCGR
jgi:hypothetical protein